MKSHVCEFTPLDLLRLAGWPLFPVALFSVVMQLGARFHLLPAPRPTLDTERTILIHQAEASRAPQNAEVILLGDSSCLMDVSARRLGEQLGQPVLSLATFSFLDLHAHALFLRAYAKANPGRLRAVVLLLHPEALRRLGSEPYYIAVLNHFWDGTDQSAGQLSDLTGTTIFKGRLLARALPAPLGGGYGRRYGFTRQLESFLTREHGSVIDPEVKPFSGNAEYRLAPTLERTSREFRSAMPDGVKLLVGITPAPAGFVGPRHAELHAGLLREWGRWLQADGLLEELPPTLPDENFTRTTHLKESAVPLYTERLSGALRPHLLSP